jgi:hypothetical protein
MNSRHGRGLLKVSKMSTGLSTTLNEKLIHTSRILGVFSQRLEANTVSALSRPLNSLCSDTITPFNSN